MEFFMKCGARKTIALSATTRNITADELTSTQFFGGKMPTLRSSSTSVALSYPYGLGEMNRKKPMVVDVALSQEWVEIITSLGSLPISSSSSSSSSFPSSVAGTRPNDPRKSPIELARTLSTLVSRLLSPPALDAATPLATPESTPCAASALKGESEDSGGSHPPNPSNPHPSTPTHTHLHRQSYPDKHTYK